MTASIEIRIQLVHVSACLKAKRWLQDNVAGWEHFSIVGEAKYLGIRLGPLGATQQWVECVNKFKDRCFELGELRLASHVVGFLFRRWAIPVLLYVAQFCELRKRAYGDQCWPPPYLQIARTSASRRTFGEPQRAAVVRLSSYSQRDQSSRWQMRFADA